MNDDGNEGNNVNDGTGGPAGPDGTPGADGTAGTEGTDGQMNGTGGDGYGGSGGSDGTDAGATRANGLTAAYYVPLRDVDPRVGVELLGKLATAGIAAYVAPTPGSKGGYGDIRPPSLPTDRLWVDGSQRTEAEAIITGTISDDEVFDQLVAMFHTSSPEVAPWPATEELGTTTRTTRRSITARQAQPPLPELTPTGEPALPEHVENYLDEHFVPEPPPPLPRLQGITILAWAMVALGILMIAFHDQIPVDFSQGSFFIAVLAIVGGFGTLVYRMHDNDHDDGDGAVV